MQDQARRQRAIDLGSRIDALESQLEQLPLDKQR
jgi:hypothetical protein